MKSILKEIVFSVWLLAGLATLVVQKNIGETMLDAAIAWRYKNNSHGK